MTKPFYIEQQERTRQYMRRQAGTTRIAPELVGKALSDFIREQKEKTMAHPDIGDPEANFMQMEANRIAQSRHDALDAEKARVRSILDNVEYRRHGGTWSLYLGVDGDRLYMQVKCAGASFDEMLPRLEAANVCALFATDDEVRACFFKHFPDEGPWTGRKWMLSPHMVLSEIVSTAYAAYERAELHEIKEAFRYKGAAVMGPHQHMDELADLMNRGILHDEVRSNGMQGA